MLTCSHQDTTYSFIFQQQAQKRIVLTLIFRAYVFLLTVFHFVFATFTKSHMFLKNYPKWLVLQHEGLPKFHKYSAKF